MNKAVEGEVIERQMDVADPRALEALNRSEIDVQIATAKRFPRSVTKFHSEAISLVSLSEDIAEECIYALERDGKTIEGPSARMAEIVAYSWGNCRAGARVIDETGEFVTAQGVFWDLEKNTAIGYEIKRRIVNKHGKRYSPDMIGVTANAACSIALRNAVLKGVPKALWVSVYAKARETIMGDFQTLGNRRQVVLGNFAKFGVQPERIYAKLAVSGEADITLEHIVTLRGILNAIREGDTTVEEQFPVASGTAQAGGAGAALKAAVAGGGVATPTSRPADAPTAASAALDPVSGGGDAPGNASVGLKDMATDPLEAELGGQAKQPAGQAKAGKLPGTPRIRKEFLKRLAESDDSNLLAEVYADVDLYIWTATEIEELATAYNKRAHELKG